MATPRRTASKAAWTGTKAAVVGVGLTATLGLVVGLTTVAMVAYAGKAEAEPVPTRATIEATQFTVPPYGGAAARVGEAFAVCPPHKRAVGGGVVQSGPYSYGLFLLANGPLDASGVTLQTGDGDVAKQWYAAVVNITGEERTFRVFALCSATSRATIEATQFTVGELTTGEASAVCPPHKRALGGGVVQSGEARGGYYLASSGPLDASGVTAQTVTGDVARQWYASVAHPFPLPQRTYRAFAICSGQSTARIKATPLFEVGVNFGDGERERFAVCSGDKRALGGGVVQSGPVGLLFFQTASGPLDESGTTLNTDDGDIARQWYVAQGNDRPERLFRAMAICE